MSAVSLEKHPDAGEVVEEITPEDLLKMPDGHRFELIDGRLVERNMGAESCEVAAMVLRILGNHIHANKLGKTFTPDCGYQAFPNKPKKVRFPDGSFVARGRLPEEKTPKGHMHLMPDLAVEVVSPNDTAEEIEEKRIDFLEAGTRMLWIVYPESRTLHVYRPDAAPRVLTEADEITGDDVLPGFRCRVAEFFEGIG